MSIIHYNYSDISNNLVLSNFISKKDFASQLIKIII
jgi:hypothetical protein